MYHDPFYINPSQSLLQNTFGQPQYQDYSFIRTSFCPPVEENEFYERELREIKSRLDASCSKFEREIRRDQERQSCINEFFGDVKSLEWALHY